MRCVNLALMAYAHMAQLECRKAPATPATPASGRAAQDKRAAPQGDTHVPQEERGRSHSQESSDSAHRCAAVQSRATEDTEEEEEAASALSMAAASWRRAQQLLDSAEARFGVSLNAVSYAD